MNETLPDIVDSIRGSLASAAPELLFAAAIITFVSFALTKVPAALQHAVAVVLLLAAGASMLTGNQEPQLLFNGLLKSGAIGFRLLFVVSALLTVAMTAFRKRVQDRLAEYYSLVFTVVLGADLLVMSENFIAVLFSMELLSLPSYLLTGFAFDRRSAEGSLKYFLFGSVATAVMLYGFSILYGLTGTATFTSAGFAGAAGTSPLAVVGVAFALAGFLYKISSAPMHPWAPDVYESAPLPVVAMFSVIPKVAGVAILAKFIVLFPPNAINWQSLLAGVAMLTLAIGNFSALKQKSARRLMGYSSIAQSGFLLIAVAAFSRQGMQFLVFYSAVYALLNFIAFMVLQTFEDEGTVLLADYAGMGKSNLWPMVWLLIAFVGLTGLPPTAGFTGKLFVFSALWDAYAAGGRPILLVTLIFAVLNTVISLFYYFRIPYFAFVRDGAAGFPGKISNRANLLAAILVLFVLLLFFRPDLLMGWINKSNFVF